MELINGPFGYYILGVLLVIALILLCILAKVSNRES